MIDRIVKLTFSPEHREAFLHLFEKHLSYMDDLEDCISLELHQVADSEATFITVSKWTSEAGLERYRSSDYFRKVWSEVKVWFCEKPEAWTLEKLM